VSERAAAAGSPTRTAASESDADQSHRLVNNVTTPISAEAEAALLGAAMLLDLENSRRALAHLTPNDFADEANRLAFEAISTLLSRGEAADPVSVLSELQHMGRATNWPSPSSSVGNDLHDMVAAVVIPLGYAPARRAVMETSVRRRIHQAAVRLSQACDSTAFDDLGRLFNVEVDAVRRCHVRTSGAAA
jgi:replicative DNA helicase